MSPEKLKKAQKKKKDQSGLENGDLVDGVRPFNILDAKQILAFTKDRLEFLSSSNQSDKLQLRSLSGNNSAIKDFENDIDPNFEGLNRSHANLLKNSA